MRGCALEHVSPEKNTRDWKPWFPLRKRTGSLAKGNLESVDSAPIWTMLRYYQLNRKQIIGRGAHFFVRPPWFQAQPFLVSISPPLPIRAFHRQLPMLGLPQLCEEAMSWLRHMGKCWLCQGPYFVHQHKGAVKDYTSQEGKRNPVNFHRNQNSQCLKGQVLMSLLHTPMHLLEVKGKKHKG